ncbi:MAG: CoA ester lyase [Phototrophicales bacterium]|nr:CoA ester lyase [Phototrophicales bacterium]
MAIRTRRALLFMPGDDRKKIEKGASMNVDSVIMDLEDGVALSRKSEARAVTSAALREISFGHTERLVRINPVLDDPSLWFHDIQETIEAHPDGYVLPKVDHAEQIQRVAVHLTRAERQYGWMEGSIRLLAILETAQGIVNMKDIADADPRLSALIFGAEDLAGDIGATRTPDGWEVFYARSKLVIFAKAKGLQAIDTPFIDLGTDDSMLRADAEQALYMGFTGKLAIHPKQVPVIQDVFTPSEEQIARAKALIAAHNDHQAHGQGVFAYEGRMVDMPMVKSAEAILARARVAGIDV